MDLGRMLLTDQKAEDRHYAALERQYGPREMQAAQQDVIIALLISSGIISKSQFVDFLERQLAARDEQRRREAGIPD